MSKESRQAGLGRRHVPKVAKEKADEPLVRGTFVPDVNDLARLREHLHERERRFYA